jgi:hypothetical protein
MAAPIGPKKVHRYTVEFKKNAGTGAYLCVRILEVD